MFTKTDVVSVKLEVADDGLHVDMTFSGPKYSDVTTRVPHEECLNWLCSWVTAHKKKTSLPA